MAANGARRTHLLERATAPDAYPEPAWEQAVRAQLDRLLSSAQFNRSERLARLLTFIVDSGVRGDTSGLKESVLGREVYDRGEDFDGRLDPIVRTEVRRLRRKLLEYYDSSGSADPIVFEIPKGGYVPAFHPRQTNRARFPGEFAGPYRILERLASGPAGHTYRAAGESGAEFAIRLLPGDVSRNARALSLLADDLGAAGVLAQDSTCCIESMEETADGWILRSSYQEGLGLDEWLLTTRPLWSETSRIIAQLLHGLASAHAAGIAHGHLKPGNVIVTAGGGDAVVKILGFGARSLAGRTFVTDPRRLANVCDQEFQDGPDEHGDVRAAGRMILQMLGGPGLPDAPPEHRTALSVLISRSMAGDPREQFANAIDLENAYLRIIADPGGAPARSFKSMAALSVCFVLALTAMLAAMTLSLR